MAHALREWVEGIAVSDGEDEFPTLTEPVAVPRQTLAGTRVTVAGGTVAVEGWDDIPGDGGVEHRVVVRLGLSYEAARRLIGQIRGVLPR